MFKNTYFEKHLRTAAFDLHLHDYEYFFKSFRMNLTTFELNTFLLSYHTEAVSQRCSVRKGVLRNFAKFTGKHLCQSLFFNKVAGLTFSYRTPPVAASLQIRKS